MSLSLKESYARADTCLDRFITLKVGRLKKAKLHGNVLYRFDFFPDKKIKLNKPKGVFECLPCWSAVYTDRTQLDASERVGWKS